MEIARKDYPHLAKLWLSDVCRDEEQLTGADYLWHFQTGNILHGGIDEPVAIETELGWVVSGPLKYSQDLVDKQEVWKLSERDWMKMLERLLGHQKVAGSIPVWGSEIVF